MKNWIIYVVLCGHGVGINIHAGQYNLEMAIYVCTKISTMMGQTFLPQVYYTFRQNRGIKSFSGSTGN